MESLSYGGVVAVVMESLLSELLLLFSLGSHLMSILRKCLY